MIRTVGPLTEQQLDENALVIPHLWRHYLHPWRGAAPTRGIKDDPAAEKVVRDLSERDDGVAALLLGEHGDPELAARARRYRGGRPDPVGAAAMASVSPPGPQRAFVDFLAAEHGTAFAACVLLETLRMRTVEVRGRSHRYEGVVIHHDTVHRAAAPLRYKHWEGVRRCRVLLAAAHDEDYAEAVQRLAGHRRTPAERRLVSYLVPARQDWVDECCTDPIDGATGPEALMNRRLLFSSLGKRAQLDTPRRQGRFRLGATRFEPSGGDGGRTGPRRPHVLPRPRP